MGAGDEHRGSSGRSERLSQALERIVKIAENARFYFEESGSDGLFGALDEVRQVSQEALDQ